MVSDISIGALVLAAGGSTRLGQPKQMVQMADKTLLQHTLDCAFGANINQVVVVLGSNHEIIGNSIRDFKTRIVVNEAWETGLSSSIKAGIETIESHHKNLDAVLVLLSDQPHVSVSLITKLIDSFSLSGKAITASEYNGIVGVPAIFPKLYFDNLKRITGDKGARKLLIEQAHNVKTITFAEGRIDIDTPSDLENFLNSENTDHK